jgi:hypothetical protein
MSRAARTFKLTLGGALRAAVKAGLKVQRAEVRQDGSFLLDFDPPAKTPTDHETSADIRKLI